MGGRVLLPEYRMPAWPAGHLPRWIPGGSTGVVGPLSLLVLQVVKVVIPWRAVTDLLPVLINVDVTSLTIRA